MQAAWSIFDRTHQNVSLDQKWRAAAVTDYVMQNPSMNVSKDLLASIYNISDFYAFFNSTRYMVQDYLLGGVTLDKRQYAVVYGYNEPRFQYIFVNHTDLNDDFF